MDLGYQSDHVIVINMGRTGSRELVNRFRNEVKPFQQVKKAVGPEMFILASTLAVAVATLSYHTIKAGLTNPVKTLKYE